MTSERDEARRRMIATRPPGPLPRVDPSVDELVGAALSAEERAELRALCERATPGEWHAADRGTGWEIHRGDASGFACWCRRPGCAGALPSGLRADLDEDDAAFIAAARTALPRLLDALERSERRRAAAWSWINGIAASACKPTCGCCETDAACARAALRELYPDAPAAPPRTASVDGGT